MIKYKLTKKVSKSVVHLVIVRLSTEDKFGNGLILEAYLHIFILLSRHTCNSNLEIDVIKVARLAHFLDVLPF